MDSVFKLKYYKKYCLGIVAALLTTVTVLNSCSPYFSPEIQMLDRVLSSEDPIKLPRPAGVSSDFAPDKDSGEPDDSLGPPTRSFTAPSNKVAIGAFQLASYLTDPACKSRELYRRIAVVGVLNPQANWASNLATKIFLLLGVIESGSLAIMTSIPGIVLRIVGSSIQKEPFLYVEGDLASKVLPESRSFSLLSWNICCVGAGYPISDGGVLPWAFRIDNIIDKIVETDADVNCLYETFDAKSAFYLCDKLKQKGYNHFYFNIGPKAVGVSSGIFVASKYNIQNPDFTPFPQDSLVGRTKNAEKGVFAFDLESHGEKFARIYSTHLQHSEQSQFPTLEEVHGRQQQMQIILDLVDRVQDRCIVVTGDLNLDDHEYKASSWQERFQKGDNFGMAKTWGGDAFCASLMGKKGSGALNLDHTMVLKGTARSIDTSLVETGYDPAVFKDGALSDHSGLLSQILV